MEKSATGPQPRAFSSCEPVTHRPFLLCDTHRGPSATALLHFIANHQLHLVATDIGYLRPTIAQLVASCCCLLLRSVCPLLCHLFLPFLSRAGTFLPVSSSFSLQALASPLLPDDAHPLNTPSALSRHCADSISVVRYEISSLTTVAAGLSVGLFRSKRN